MQKQRKSLVVIAILLIFAGAIAWYFGFKEYQQHDAVSIHDFPRTTKGWESEELTITEEEYAILETRNAFARRYKKDGNEVDILIVYSQNNRKVSHPPEICYTGSGITILSKRNIELEANPDMKITANKLLLEQRKVQQLSVYWFKVGREFTENYWKQQALIAMDTLLNKPASSALIRISTVIGRNGGTVETAEMTIRGFVQAIGPLLFKYLP